LATTQKNVSCDLGKVRDNLVKVSCDVGMVSRDLVNVNRNAADGTELKIRGGHVRGQQRARIGDDR